MKPLRHIVLLFVSVFFLVAANPGIAISRNQSALYLDTLAVKLGYTSSFQDTSEINGGVSGTSTPDEEGYALSFAVVFNNDYAPALKPYIDYTRLTFDDQYFTAVGLGVRHDFRRDDSPLELYLAGGLTYFFSQWRTTPVPEPATGLIGSESFGGTVKSGMDYYITDNLAINLGLRWDLYDQDTTLIENNATTTFRNKSSLSLLTGLVYRFGKKEASPAWETTDRDGDGIMDNFDHCPWTLANVPVDDHGCPLEHFGFNLDFEFAEFRLAHLTNRPNFSAVGFLYKHPDYHVRITGHSDNVGSEAANRKIALQRATEAKNFLVNNGIDENRITISGKGSENPIASNKTAEGRASNRRIHVEFIKIPGSSSVQ